MGKLRQSAQGQACALNICGVCNHNPETTVLAHLPSEFKGMGNKSPDLGCAVFSCSDCHDAIDSRTMIMSKEDKLFYTLRGLQRTIRRWHEDGHIEIR